MSVPATSPFARGQKVTAPEQHWGRVTWLTVDGGGTHYWHPEHARHWHIQILPVVAADEVLLLPYFAKALEEGYVGTISNDVNSARRLRIRNAFGAALPNNLIPIGWHADIFLTDNSTDLGSWRIDVWNSASRVARS